MSFLTSLPRGEFSLVISRTSEDISNKLLAGLLETPAVEGGLIPYSPLKVQSSREFKAPESAVAVLIANWSPKLAPGQVQKTSGLKRCSTEIENHRRSDIAEGVG